MKTITFDVKKRNQIALEMDEVIPDKIYSWEAEDFDKYAVPVGNSRFPITDFFDITVEGTADSPAEVKMIFNGDCGRVKYIGNKMSAGEIIVNGDADLHVGAEMSGPIIQNGKLIGAVTHVLIGDPTTGYGIFIENMLNAANGVNNSLQKAA